MKLILLIVAIICLILAALGVSLGSFSIGWAGLAFFAASFLPIP
jgi:hypothetical protein